MGQDEDEKRISTAPQLVSSEAEAVGMAAGSHNAATGGWFSGLGGPVRSFSQQHFEDGMLCVDFGWG